MINIFAMNFIKRLLLPLLMTLLVTVVFYDCGHNSGFGSKAQSAGDTGTAKIIFNDYEHHFGKVSQGEKLAYVFMFENQGTGSLIIASVTASCGCTVPKYDRKPVAPGNSGNIEVVFNTEGRSGMQTKTITVKSNAKPQVVLLKITAEVEEEK
jgi:hypothetical protein